MCMEQMGSQASDQSFQRGSALLKTKDSALIVVWTWEATKEPRCWIMNENGRYKPVHPVRGDNGSCLDTGWSGDRLSM